ncbi:histidinol-phosphate aminotransferase family protein [Flavobacteriaceae bacterium]|nr:histidinol-phosphate aminotransferase family protein [Flavobacteriaceae bacterium]
MKERFKELKQVSGTHSPSLNTIKDSFPELKIKVDACFLSNPYATELFLTYFKKRLLDTGEINKLIEFYPSQNKIISGYIGEAINFNPKNIFVCNGAIEGIQAVFQNFLKGKISIPIPTFSSYYEYCHDSLSSVFYQLDKESDYKLDLDRYTDFIQENKINNALIINPNNPNGSYNSIIEIESFVEKNQNLDFIIIDESFIHFAYENENLKMNTVQSLVLKYDNLIIIKSMSKDFGIAGVRSGYVIMKEERVKSLLKNGYLWNINSIAEFFFHLYKDKDFLSEYNLVRKKYISETKKFIIELTQLKSFKIIPSKANFALLEIVNGKSSEEIMTTLLFDYGIYVRDCSDKVGLKGQYIRVASRSREENKKIIKALNDIQ